MDKIPLVFALDLKKKKRKILLSQFIYLNYYTCTIVFSFLSFSKVLLEDDHKFVKVFICQGKRSFVFISLAEKEQYDPYFLTFFLLKVEFLAVEGFSSLNSYCEWENPGKKKEILFQNRERNNLRICLSSRTIPPWCKSNHETFLLYNLEQFGPLSAVSLLLNKLFHLGTEGL